MKIGLDKNDLAYLFVALQPKLNEIFQAVIKEKTEDNPPENKHDFDLVIDVCTRFQDLVFAQCLNIIDINNIEIIRSLASLGLVNEDDFLDQLGKVPLPLETEIPVKEGEDKFVSLESKVEEIKVKIEEVESKIECICETETDKKELVKLEEELAHLEEDMKTIEEQLEDVEKEIKEEQ